MMDEGKREDSKKSIDQDKKGQYFTMNRIPASVLSIYN